MPHFELFGLIRSLHLIALGLGGGSVMVILVLVGLEDTREDLQGLTSVLWKRTAAWAFRIAVLLGLALLAMKFKISGDNPFMAKYLHWKLALVFLLLMMSEMAPRALAARKRGAALLAFVFFLLAVFVSVNHDAFGFRTAHLGPYTGNVEAPR